MSRPLRVLYYNWVDYLDAEGRGGGVTRYQRNVIEGLNARDDTEVVFLCSGLSYDLPVRSPRWEVIRHGPECDAQKRFEIVNSGVLAPAHHSFGDPAQVSHDSTRDVFFDFVDRTGPYDVIHFNNLEGLPAEVLEIKQRHPQSQVVLSLHNYYPICPQVNLWFAERETCEDFEGGARCSTCLTHQHDGRLLRVANGLSYRLRCAGLQPGSWTYDVAFRGVLGLGGRMLRMRRWLWARLGRSAQNPVLDPQSGRERADAFAQRRARMIGLINTQCDRVLCVSDAVRVLAERYGIDPGLTQVSYIGTRAAELFESSEQSKKIGPFQTLTLGYLGYMRHDKGFFFLLDALEELPVEEAAHIHVVVAARAVDAVTLARVMQLKDRLGGVTYHNGYTHDDLDAILAPVDVGVVPVLWHDNLPQVAIEMHARHIPILSSQMGGASELGNCDAMVFEAGNQGAFAERLAALLAGRIDMKAYWRNAKAPTSLPAHFEDLVDVYGTVDRPE